MKIGMPKRVLDPYVWLPGYGESAVATRTAGLDLVVDIAYERPVAGHSTLKLHRQLIFDGTFTHYQTFFPGPSLFEAEGDYRLGDLTEFQDSEVCRQVSGWFNWSIGHPRHYAIAFLAQNLALHVISRGVTLTPERRV